MLNRIETLSIKFLNLLLPSQCLLCHLPSEQHISLCQACITQLPFKKFSCAQCAFPLPISNAERICGDCLTRSWQFDRCFCLFHYEQSIQKLLIGLKFFDQLLNASLFGYLLKMHLSHWYPDGDLPQAIIPVPLHAARTRKRGFNQAIEMAKILSKETKIPLLSCCQRIKNTQPQSELDKSARIANLQNAFIIKKPVPYHHIAILDDIFTTGNTVDTLAKALRLRGVTRIDVWCIARAE